MQIVGIGSGTEPDDVGWRIVARLARMDLGASLPNVELSFENCAVPAQLPALVGEVDTLILVDALRDRAWAEVLVIEWRDLVAGVDACSSHGVEVADVMGLLPLVRPALRDVRLFGVGVGDPAPVNATATDALVERALPAVLNFLSEAAA